MPAGAKQRAGARVVEDHVHVEVREVDLRLLVVLRRSRCRSAPVKINLRAFLAETRSNTLNEARIAMNKLSKRFPISSA